MMHWSLWVSKPTPPQSGLSAISALGILLTGDVYHLSSSARPPRANGSYFASPTFRETWNLVRTSAMYEMPTGLDSPSSFECSRWGRGMWSCVRVSCRKDPSRSAYIYNWVGATGVLLPVPLISPPPRLFFAAERDRAQYAVRVGFLLSSLAMSCCQRDRRGPRQSPPGCFWEVHVHISGACELFRRGFSLYVRHPQSLLCPHWLKRRFTRSQPSLFVPTCSCHVCE